MAVAKSMSGHQRPNRGASDSWLTPYQIIEALGPFDLDPCCPVQMPWVTAKKMILQPADGLAVKWRGIVWLNPPFGDEAKKWVARLAAHGNGLLLCSARTETDWWHEHIWPRVTSILFLDKRPHFHYPYGSRARFNSGSSIVIAAYGKECTDRLRTRKADCLKGKLVTL